jgi:hypothetical protein
LSRSRHLQKIAALLSGAAGSFAFGASDAGEFSTGEIDEETVRVRPSLRHAYRYSILE